MAQSSKLSVEEQLKAQAKSAEQPAFVEAVFSGNIYQNLSGSNNVAPFTETVKVPVSWLHDAEQSPIALFKAIYAPRIFKGNPSYSGVRVVELISTSELPPLSFEQALLWTADMEGLVALAKVHAKAVKVDLYPDASTLRKAIERSIAEPKAFDSEQKTRAESKALQRRRMELELEALAG